MSECRSNPDRNRFSSHCPEVLRASVALATLALLLANPAAASKRCDWHGPKTKGEATYKKCIDFAAINGTSLEIPKNVTRISADGISFCEGAFKLPAGGDADIVYMMDNSGSMKDGETGLDEFGKAYNTPPGDPNGIRDKVIRRAMRQERATAGVATAGFVSFIGISPKGDRSQILGAEAGKLQHPLDISKTNPTGQANLDKLISNVWKYNPSEAAVPKTSATAQTAVTFWTEPITLAKSWFSPDSGFVKTNNHAIILISDGAISDWTTVKAMAASLPPVYGIHLGVAGQAAHLDSLTRLTGGKYWVVDPTDTVAFQQVMQTIIGVITKNPLPKSVQVVNTTDAPPQTSKSQEVNVNPDGSMGVLLDSIIGLKSGSNAIQIHVTNDDNSVLDFTFNLDVATDEIAVSTADFSCYDMPTLTAVDKSGQIPVIYRPDATSYTLKLTRSPSELRQVSVAATSETGDLENVALGNPNSALGFPSQSGDFKFNPQDGSPTAYNKILEVDNAGNLTFTWTHPRDARETVSYVLPGKGIPTLDGAVMVKIKDPITSGQAFDPIKLAEPVVIVDSHDKCIVNCTGTQIFWSNPAVPTWLITVKSPITYSIKIFDNLGQFVTTGQGEISQAAWDALAKSGDSAVIQLKIPPVSKSGQQLGTGAYLMKAEIVSLGSLVTKNAAGDMVLLTNSKREYLKRFGYVRH